MRNLFQNIPVRLAYMKEHRVSIAKVKSLIVTYTLVNDIRISLQLRGNKRHDWNVQAFPDAFDVAISIHGRNLMQRYTYTSWTENGVTIEGIFPNANQGALKYEKLT